MIETFVQVWSGNACLQYIASAHGVVSTVITMAVVSLDSVDTRRFS